MCFPRGFPRSQLCDTGHPNRSKTACSGAFSTSASSFRLYNKQMTRPKLLKIHIFRPFLRVWAVSKNETDPRPSFPPLWASTLGTGAWSATCREGQERHETGLFSHESAFQDTFSSFRPDSHHTSKSEHSVKVRLPVFTNRHHRFRNHHCIDLLGQKRSNWRYSALHSRFFLRYPSQSHVTTWKIKVSTSHFFPLLTSS